ncbi:MAG: thiamine-phosphate kinase [Comamonas sp.]|nr:thiamine-phosphate kinase [Comamonas sp.]
MGEFDLIRRFFQRPVQRSPLGVGDDCALLAPRAGMQLAVSSDMLVQGRHFLPNVHPRLLGHKALAVNLSDLAACGAQPLAFTLALALPRADAPWCEAFSAGLLALADAHHCELVGGDTTQGPLNLCITVFGEVPSGQAILRNGAQVGDDLWVSGTLGDARLALDALLRQHALPAPVLAQARQRLEAPTPRVALGQALRGIASSAIDVSDGLLGDLGHILQASGVGASVDIRATRQLLHAGHHPLMSAMALSRLDACTLAGGDDYELCFTAPPEQRAAVEAAARATDTPVTRIGSIEAQHGLRVLGPDGRPLTQRWPGFDHFA